MIVDNIYSFQAFTFVILNEFQSKFIINTDDCDSSHIKSFFLGPWTLNQIIL